MTLTTRKKLLQQQQEEIRKAKNKKKYDNWLDKPDTSKNTGNESKEKGIGKNTQKQTITGTIANSKEKKKPI